MERLLEDVSFHASKLDGANVAIDARLRRRRGSPGIAGDDELARSTFCSGRSRYRDASQMLERILGIILPVFSIIALGYLCGRRVKPDMAMVNRISMNVLAPALIFSALVVQGLRRPRRTRLLLAGSVGIVLGSGLLAWPIARLLREDPRTFVPPMMFNNCGNMGLPLAVLAFGEAGLRPDGRAVHDLEPAALHARRVDHRPPRALRPAAAQPDGVVDGRRASRSRSSSRRCPSGSRSRSRWSATR